MPGRKDLPDTLKRSPRKAQETYLKALESAHQQYDSEERAHRTALAALKHSFKKVGDRWEPKDRRGPSDPQARRSGAAARRGTARTYRGIDVEGSSKADLYEQARKAGIPGRSRMSKRELAQALARRS